MALEYCRSPWREGDVGVGGAVDEAAQLLFLFWREEWVGGQESSVTFLHALKLRRVDVDGMELVAQLRKVPGVLCYFFGMVARGT